MDHNELVYAEFIKDRIQKNGGSLKFQHISGQLSQLEHNVRSAIGASPKELMNFLKKYNDLFTVSDGLVSLKSSSGDKETSAAPKDINVNGRSDKESAFPKVLNDVAGVVIKVQPAFGFITVKDPVKASVYFTPSCFNDANKTLLKDLGIIPGKKVRLNAKIGNLDFESKYRATKVWIPANVENEVLHPEGFFPKIPKTRETGLYDADTSEGNGTIQRVFDSYGFIIVDGDQNNTVFFHKNKVCNVENLHDLTKIFRSGDLVEYKAVRSQKSNMKVRWEATKVWMRKKIKAKSKEKGESATSDYESIGSQSRNSKVPKSSDFDKAENKLESKEISNETGKIYPNSKGTVIKFGERDSKLADADSCLFYLHKVQVEDVSWEFSDGDVVKFDGIKIKSPPGYKALLAWVGDKPDVVPIAFDDFPEPTDEDIEDVSENESCISKTSSNSALSENYLNLSKTKAQKGYSSTSSLISNSSKKSRNRSRSKVHEVEKYSNYNGNDSHSISSNSRSSQYSGSNNRQRRSKSRNSRVDEMKRFPKHTEEDSYSASSNSRSSHHSAYDESRQRRSKSRNSQHKKNYRSNSVHNSHSQLTNCRSKASSKESVNSLSSDVKIKLKPNPDLYKNWGDTPYPDDNDEISKIYLKAHGREGIQRKNNNYSSENISSGKSSPCSEEMDKEMEKAADNLVLDDFSVETDLNTSDKVSNNRDQVKSSFSSRYAAEIFLSDEDFSDALEEVNDDTLETAANDLNEEEDTETHEEKPKSYIKRFQDLEGHVKKVFCRFAEIENERLRKPGTFFWNEMYHNGAPVPDKFDDLKEVVSLGQIVKFNCFEIVDDVGTYFLKVTVAWKGSKPKIMEETPEEYIIKNNIRFSGKEIPTSDDLVDRNCSESMRPLNAKSASTSTVAPRKFLTVASMSDDNDSDEETDQPSPSEDLQNNALNEDLQNNALNEDLQNNALNEDLQNNALNEDLQNNALNEDLQNNSLNEDLQSIALNEDLESNLNTQDYINLRENALSGSENMDIPQLTDVISKMLEKFKNSQIDSSIAASDLVNMILSTVGPEKSSSSQVNTSPSFESTETTQRTEMADSYAQTIITGKIFSEGSLLDSLK